MFTKVTYAVPKVILVSYNEICREMAMQEYLTPGGVLLGIFGGGVPHASLNPDPISDQKMPFSTPVFRPVFDRLMFVVFVQTGHAFFVD